VTAIVLSGLVGGIVRLHSNAPGRGIRLRSGGGAMPDPCVQGFVFGQASDKLQGVRVLAESRAYGVGHCVVRAVVIADHAGDAVIQSGDLESAWFGVGGRQVFDFVDGDVHGLFSG
jgi:hypothetical protein